MASVVQSEAETFSSDATKYLGNQSLAETDEINAMQAEIESLQEELADLAKQEEQLKLQEEYALLQKYLQLSQVVKERDSEREAFLLNRENMVCILQKIGEQKIFLCKAFFAFCVHTFN